MYALDIKTNLYNEFTFKNIKWIKRLHCNIRDLKSELEAGSLILSQTISSFYVSAEQVF